MLAASKRNEGRPRPFKLKVAVWVFWLVLPSHHINSSIRRGAMLAGFEAKRKTCPAIQVEGGCLGFLAHVAIAPHKLVNPPWRDAGDFKPKRKICQITQ
jgi:hypothetical protein